MSRLGRLVLDTSTLVGALLSPQSIPRQALMLALTHFDLCVSEATLEEAQTVFGRPKFDRYHTREYRSRFLAMYRQHTLLIGVEVEDDGAARHACRDPADAKFLALAHACAAEVLVSSDQDLLVLDGWQGIAIQSPADFVEAMERSDRENLPYAALAQSQADVAAGRYVAESAQQHMARLEALLASGGDSPQVAAKSPRTRVSAKKSPGKKSDRPRSAG